MDPGDLSLLARLRWLVGLRWLAAAGVVTLAAICSELLGFNIPTLWLQLVGLTVAAYNVAFRCHLLRLRKSDGPITRALTLSAQGQIIADLVALAAVTHFTGGIESPLSFFFVFHMIFASMILSFRAAAAMAVLAIGLYGAVLLGEGLRLLPHYPLGIGAAPNIARSIQAWPIFTVFSATMLVAVYLTGTVVGELRDREQQLAGLTRELAQQAGACQLAYGELATTQSSQLEYMRRVAHELKSPLAAIAMSLDAALLALPDAAPDKERAMLQRAGRRARAALTLTEDLLTLSELREAAPAEEEAPVSISHLIENVVEEEEFGAQQRSVHFVVEIEEGLPLIHGRRGELTTMLRNLVTNAVKFSPDDGAVTLRARAESDGVTLEVQDQGIGIAPDEVDRIFDEFYRTAASRKAGIPGTGLGLPIVKSVVERHGGRITVDSTPGAGTTFRVHLPADNA